MKNKNKSKNKNKNKRAFRDWWTTWEDALLEKHYRDFSAREIQQRFLPDRTIYAIHHRARALKVQKWPLHHPRADWTDEDVATLCEVYPLEGIQGACRQLPQYWKSSIRDKACELGLHLLEPVGQRWSTEDRQRLIDHLHLAINELRALFPQYSATSIVNARTRLRRKSVAVWSQEELATLQQHYRHLGTSMLQRRFFPMRLQSDIRRQVEEIRRQAPPEVDTGWSAQECALLRKYYLTLDSDTFRKRHLPHRTQKAIEGKAQRLGILKRSHNRWTQDELSILKEHFSRGGAEAVHAILPHRSHATIYAKAHSMDIYRQEKRGPANTWSSEEIQRLKALDHLPVKELLRHFPDRTQWALKGKRTSLRNEARSRDNNSLD